jgi:hypothetical protein
VWGELDQRVQRDREQRRLLPRDPRQVGVQQAQDALVPDLRMPRPHPTAPRHQPKRLFVAARPSRETTTTVIALTMTTGSVWRSSSWMNGSSRWMTSR